MKRISALVLSLLVIPFSASCNNDAKYRVNEEELWAALHLTGVNYLQVKSSYKQQVLELSPHVYHRIIDVVEEKEYDEYFVEEKDGIYTKYERKDKTSEHYDKTTVSKDAFLTTEEYSKLMLSPIEDEYKEYKDFIYDGKKKEYHINFLYYGSMEHSYLRFTNKKLRYLINWYNDETKHTDYNFAYQEYTPPVPKVKL